MFVHDIYDAIHHTICIHRVVILYNTIYNYSNTNDTNNNETSQ